MKGQDNERDEMMKHEPDLKHSSNLEDVEPPTSLVPNVLARLGLLHTLPTEQQEAVAQDSTSWQARVLAIEAPGEQEERVSLEACLQDEHEAVRMAALRALGKLKKQMPKVKELIFKALKDPHREVRATAVQMLGTQGEREREALLSALEDEEELVRIAAIQMLGRLGRQAPVERLIEALEDAEWPVRETAALTLGTLGERVPIEPLVDALYDTYKFVREAAAIALGERILAAIKMIIQDLQESDDTFEREAAARALGELGKRAPLELLVKPLIGALEDPESDVRMAGVLALGQLGEHSESIKALGAALLDDDEGVREAAELVLDSPQPEISVPLQLTGAEPETEDNVLLVPQKHALSTKGRAKDVNYVGQRFGNYMLESVLGAGSIATVYLGKHIFLNTFAAIKVLKADLLQEGRESFLTEAQTIAHLNHPHIVRVLEFGLEGETPFLVMEYAPNGTSRQRHPKGEQVPLEAVVDYMKQIASALQYAHDQGVIHRDIKPENILLNAKNELLLSDFGIAALVKYSKRHPYEHRVSGTPAYMAPERFHRKLEQASDQYSLGIVVYEWFCGDYPFSGSSFDIAAQHQHKSPPGLHGRVPQLSRTVEKIVLRALVKEPEARFASVQEFADALAEAFRLEQSQKQNTLRRSFWRRGRGQNRKKQ